jgi:hypothetical protein
MLFLHDTKVTLETFIMQNVSIVFFYKLFALDVATYSCAYSRSVQPNGGLRWPMFPLGVVHHSEMLVFRAFFVGGWESLVVYQVL